MSKKFTPYLSCGIRVDGRDVGLVLPDSRAAEEAAMALFARGFRRVEIFERDSGKAISFVTSYGRQRRQLIN